MIHDVQQNSEAWECLRRGRLTASEAGEWLVAEPKLTLTKSEICTELDRLQTDYKKAAKVGDLAALLPPAIIQANQGFLKKDQEARQDTMCRMLGQELSTTINEEWAGNRFTDFGNAFEDEACAAFEIQTGYTLKKVGFVTLDGFDYFGCSPDRYVYDDAGEPLGVLEVKCKPIEHSRIVINGALPKEHRMQVHFQMAITGLDRAWFYAYSPDMKALTVEVPADEFTQRILDALETFDRDYRAFRDLNLPKLKISA